MAAQRDVKLERYWDFQFTKLHHDRAADAPEGQPPKLAERQSSSGVKEAARFIEDEIAPQCVQGHVESYRYLFEADINGEMKPHVSIRGQSHELLLVSGWNLNLEGPQVKKDFDHLTRVSKILRMHDRKNIVRHDEELFVDLEDFAEAFRKEVPGGIPNLSVADIVRIAFTDNKNRFQLLCAAGLPIASSQGMTYWPFHDELQEEAHQSQHSSEDEPRRPAVLPSHINEDFQRWMYERIGQIQMLMAQREVAESNGDLESAAQLTQEIQQLNPFPN